MRQNPSVDAAAAADVDVIVVGAGLGGLYALHRFSSRGLSVVGLEAAGGVGGVWYHNRYPGARVDVDSIDYCYYFSEEIFEKWRWSERYAAQPELLAYLEFVSDTMDLRRHIRFDTRMTSACWSPKDARYHVGTHDGAEATCRFLVMTAGQLSSPRHPDIPGLDRFRGEWVMTSQWPEANVQIDDRRVGIIGTGSSGVQAITALAPRVGRLTVFQRTANYVVPARNRPAEAEETAHIGAQLPEERELLMQTPGGTHLPLGTHPADHYTSAQQQALLERQWKRGGQGMTFVFTDQGTNQAANNIVSEFVRAKVRALVADERTAELLVPKSYPIGTRRLALDTGYYETFNRDNVTLVDVNFDPIRELTETGIRTENTTHELDLIVFALGFDAFTGPLEAAGIRNEDDESPTDRWTEGPFTLLGLMTPGFPNLFTPTGPGSPSVIANLFIENEFAIDWIADCIDHLNARGLQTIEATETGAAAWTAHCADMARPLLRRQVDNYMVRIAANGERVFLPYAGGFHRYVDAARQAAARGYEGFLVK